VSASPSLEHVPEDWARALAVVAHPDDLEYGAASAVARWTSQGKEIVYVLVTRGEAGIDGMAPEIAGPARADEERRSATVVGVTEVEFLDHADGVIEYGLPLRRDIARAVRRHRPEVIISLNYRRTWGSVSWNSADHRAVGEAVVDGARDASNRWVFPELNLDGVAPWPGCRMILFNGSSRPTHAVDVTAYLERGIASLKCHEAYIAGLGGEFDADAFLRGGAESIGRQLGCDFAVSFELVPL
jgi:LmbE family N-acetylglucosaminyl deacetylase